LTMVASTLGWGSSSLGGLGELPGVGIDIEDVGRFAEPDGRLLDAEELAYCARQADPAAARAGRWCAKEAVAKACARFLQLSLREIGIRSGPSGRPEVVLPARAAEMGLAAEVSISHTGTMAVAVAVAGFSKSEGV
jgi:holo-[acyl-carrier protein] synthase